MTQAVLELTHDHQAIQNVTAGMMGLAQTLEDGGDASRKLLRNLTLFIDTFADHCHHEKEERYLFPLLQKKENPEIIAQLPQLAREHVDARALAASLEQAAVAYLAGSPGARAELARVIRALAVVYDRHIWNEEHMLLPLVEATLSPSEQTCLRDKFSEVEWYVGLDIHRSYEVLAEQIKGLAAAQHPQQGVGA